MMPTSPVTAPLTNPNPTRTALPSAAPAAAPAPAPAAAPQVAPATPAIAGGVGGGGTGAPHRSVQVLGAGMLTAGQSAALDQAWAAVVTATQGVTAAESEYSSALSALAAIDVTSPTGATLNAEAYKTASARLQDAAVAVANAKQKEAASRSDYAAAYQKAIDASTPEQQQANAAAVSKAQTDAQMAQAQYQAYVDAAPDQKTVAAQQITANDLANQKSALDLQLQQETDPLRKQQLQQQIDANNLSLQSAQTNLSILQQTAPSTVEVAKQQVTQGQQQIAANDVSIQQAQVALDTARKQLAQLPTDDQARRAIEQQLDTAQAQLDGLRQTTSQQAQLFPISQAQGQANVAATQASTRGQELANAQATQGTLAGLDDYIKAQKDAIAKGLITPDQANQALTARLGGTDIYNASQQAENAQVNRMNYGLNARQQDVGALNQRVGTFGSMANQGLTTLAGMNTYAPPGSQEGARAIGGYIQAMLNAMGGGGPQGFTPPPAPPAPAMPPFLQQFAGGQQPATNAPVTINIGTPQPAPQPAPAPQATAQALNPMRPATPADVQRIWGIHTGTEGAGNPWAGGNTPAPGTTWRAPA